MKRLAALFFIVTLSLGVSFVVKSFNQVQAQTVSPSPVVTPPPINLELGGTSQEDFNNQINALTVTYRNQLTTYRNDEKAFQIAKDQYYQIQTLASLEQAVRQTRQVMLTRLDVLLTYFTIARLTLQNTKGLDTEVKTTVLKDVDMMIADLKAHRQVVDKATDRPGLLAAAVQFAAINPRVKSLSTRLSTMVAYGNLQTVSDKTKTIKGELQVQVESSETDPLQLATKKRGLDEVQRNLTDIDAPLQKIRSEIDPRNQQSYGDLNPALFTNDLASIFGGLSRSLSYLKELVKN